LQVQKIKPEKWIDIFMENKFFIIFLLKYVPLRLKRIFVAALARIFYHLSLKHRLIATQNLARSFPEMSPSQIRTIAKGSYKSAALIAADFCDILYLTRDNLQEKIFIKGLDHYQEACREGKGVLLFGAHFGNWEMGNAALAIATAPFAFIYRIMDSPFLEEMITRVRASYGNVSVSKENAMRPMIRLLKKGATINLLIDQNVAWYQGVFVEFFGRPACTTSGLSLLALHTGAPVLPTFTRRLPNGKYILEIGKKVDLIRSGNRNRDVLQNTQNFTRIVEERIRQYPEQWFWVHHRWKTRLCQAKINTKTDETG
jgi:Kdo2-lipid IVA lauroyltransferase/acyltransferase